MEITFEAFNIAFFSTLLWYYINFFKPFFIKTNILDFDLVVILLKMEENNKLHLIAFCLKNILAIKINYKIHNKELLNIKYSFKEWHHYLEITSNRIIVYMNHKKIDYFTLIRILNCCQVYWSMSSS